MPTTKPLALITGGSGGIGLELAKVFASEGYDLIIAADSAAKLKEAVQQIEPSNEKARIETVVVDLSKPAGPQKLYDSVQELGQKVDVLVNNAGRGVWGDFARETDLKDELAMIQLNAASVIAVTKLFVGDMVRRGSGKILITASEASLRSDRADERLRRHQGLRVFIRAEPARGAEGHRHHRHGPAARRDADGLLHPRRYGGGQV